MANSTISIFSCNMTDTFWTIKNVAFNFSYFILPPLFFVAGILGHLIGYLAFQKEARKNSSHISQANVMMAEIVKIVSVTMLIVAVRWWSGREGNIGVDWYMRNYVLMWYAAHVVSPQKNSASIVCLLLTVIMAADRLFALSRPHQYSALSHKKFQRSTLIACVVIGCSVNLFDIGRYYVSEDGDKYKILVDESYMSTKAVTVLSQVATFTQIAGVIALIVCNIGAVKAFRRMCQQQKAVSNDKRSNEKKKVERTLLFLTLSQCTFTLIHRTVFIAFYISIFADPTFLSCGARLFAPIVDIADQVCTVANFYVALCVSGPFRRLIRNGLPIRCRPSTVAPISQIPINNAAAMPALFA